MPTNGRQKLVNELILVIIGDYKIIKQGNVIRKSRGDRRSSLLSGGKPGTS
nr:hypothetical protein [Nostoc sp. ChiSLP03a]MDZ8211313.1 hypothetical protein [Nostoc sp. ChiSLP03a]